MSAWVKRFTDETTEVGSDQNIALGKSSWTKGRLDNIKEVFITDGLSSASFIFPNTQWHQFDRYKVEFDTKKSVRIFRAIQVMITEDYVDKYICYNCNNARFMWACIKDFRGKGASYFKIQNEHVSKWLTLLVSINDKPQLLLTEKGRFYGGIQLTIS